MAAPVFAYHVQMTLALNEDFPERKLNAFRGKLEEYGKVEDFTFRKQEGNISVSTDHPGSVLEEAVSYGVMYNVEVSNLKDVSAVNKAEDDGSAAEGDTKAQEEAVASDPSQWKEYGFVSVCAGEGLAAIFKELGTDEVITGGQTMNPSTEDILNAVQKVPARNIFVLPNNKNIILASEQAAALCEDKHLVVIPTANIPQGINALINFNEDIGVEENTAHMKDDLGAVKTGQVTYAVRDTTIEGTEIKDGQIMAIGDQGLLAVGDIKQDVVVTMIAKMAENDPEIISIYYGEETPEEEAKAIADEIEIRYPDCEIELHYGGQPVYYYIVSVE